MDVVWLNIVNGERTLMGRSCTRNDILRDDNVFTDDNAENFSFRITAY